MSSSLWRPSPGWGRLLVLGGMLIAMSGCGDAGVPTAESAASGPVGGGASTAPTADPASGGPGEQTISGVIIEGLRPHCRVVQTGQGRFALTGSPTTELVVGDQVQVTGQARPDLINPCGRTFVVVSVVRQ